jgi:phosphatidylethanolamine/phosphatidyl-N-methylethanolamine N-methyltransferase
MLRSNNEHRVFFREFRDSFQTTGAIAPSGRHLARALARFVRQPGDAPRRILEVGPGTGAVTRAIVEALGPADQLDLVELNAAFVEVLRRRFESDPPFVAVADRARVLHQAIEELPADGGYDVVVSGLPLNNFSADLVARILECFPRLLRPSGTLSFFEYVGVRPARSLISGQAERQRLRSVGSALDAVLAPHEFLRERVWRNLPPAWVHHLRFDASR